MRRRQPRRDVRRRRRLVVLAMQFPLNLLSPLAPAGLSFQLEHFLGQFLALFGSLLTKAKARFLGGERRLPLGGSCLRRLAFAQGRRRLALGRAGNGHGQFLFPIVFR